MTFDALGNLLTVDGPLASADIGRTRYNAARQVIGSVSPDRTAQAHSSIAPFATPTTARPAFSPRLSRAT